MKFKEAHGNTTSEKSTEQKDKEDMESLDISEAIALGSTIHKPASTEM